MQSFQRSLGGIVETRHGAGHDTRDARYAENVPAVLATQDRQCRLDDPQRPKKVGLELSLHVFQPSLFNRADEGITGIVQHDIKSAEMPVGLSNSIPDQLFIGYVYCRGKTRSP